MTLNFDCCFLISKYLKDFDYISFCSACNLQVDSNNLTSQFIEDNIMELYEINVDLHRTLHDLDWYSISIYRNLSESFLREYSHYVHWQNVCMFQQLSEEFMKEFEGYVDWDIISSNQRVSKEFIREFKDRMNWRIISECRLLSEEFIQEFKDYVDWSCISTYQNLSDKFIEEFRDRIDWERISRNEKIYRESDENVHWYLNAFVNTLFLGIIISWFAINSNLFHLI